MNQEVALVLFAMAVVKNSVGVSNRIFTGHDSPFLVSRLRMDYLIVSNGLRDF